MTFTVRNLHCFRVLHVTPQAAARERALLAMAEQCNAYAQAFGQPALPDLSDSVFINYAMIDGAEVPYEFAHSEDFEASWQAACDWYGERNIEYLGCGPWVRCKSMKLAGVLA